MSFVIPSIRKCLRFFINFHWKIYGVSVRDGCVVFFFRQAEWIIFARRNATMIVHRREWALGELMRQGYAMIWCWRRGFGMSLSNKSHQSRYPAPHPPRETDLRTRIGVWSLINQRTDVENVRERASHAEYPCKVFCELGNSLMPLSLNKTPFLPLLHDRVMG